MPSGLPAFDRFLILVHAGVGTVALAAGAGALAARKGGRGHVLAGRIFGGAMLAALALAAPAIHARGNLLLLLLGTLTLYMVLRGWRAPRIRRSPSGPQAFDLALMALAALASVSLLALGGWVTVRDGTPAGFGGACIGLGAAGLLMVRADRRRLLGAGPPPSAWVEAHVGSMIGALIAATTAVVAVNVRSEAVPTAVIWLTPTALGVPLILWWLRRVRSGGRASSEAPPPRDHRTG